MNEHTTGTQMNTYAILINAGLGFANADVRSYVNADTPQQARKAFLAKHTGAWYANAESIKATRVSTEPMEDADLNAQDWLKGGKFYRGE